MPSNQFITLSNQQTGTTTVFKLASSEALVGLSLRPQPPLPPVPDDTARVARAAFRRGSRHLLLRDRLGAVFAAADFADLYPAPGQPAYALAARPRHCCGALASA